MTGLAFHPLALTTPARDCDRIAETMGGVGSAVASCLHPDTGTAHGTAHTGALLLRLSSAAHQLAAVAAEDAATLRAACVSYTMVERMVVARAAALPPGWGAP